MTPGDLGGLRDEDWERLRLPIERFEAAWFRGERPRIDDYLSQGEPHRQTLLVELVHAELEFRIKAGEPASVEEYLGRYPSLGLDRLTVLDLIRAEWTLRRRREPGLAPIGSGPDFPGLGDDLERDSAVESTVAGPFRSGRPNPSANVPAEGPLPRPLGKYELRVRVGAGTFGVVYRAWDTVLNREVAVKVPRPEAMAAPSDLRVFLREARNAIDLQHDHIVAIFDAGPIEGTVCLVRAFIDGMTLAERLKEGPVTPDEAAALMASVVDALEHAHGRGIIHRDLKPSNILLDQDGRPHVSDFGLAKRESGDSTLSPAGQVGTMIGTPAYMSPEQARGQAHLVDARSDVYSAGVVLYELLTGSLPFRGRGRMLQVQIQETEPTPPRRLNDEVPRDLETICLRAMAKVPSERYPTARAMADEINHFLQGQPVGPRPDPSRRKASRPSRKKLVAVAVVLGGLAGFGGYWGRAEALRQHQVPALIETIRAMETLATIPYDPSLDGAGAHRRYQDEVHARSAALLTRLALDGNPKLRDELVRPLSRLAEREGQIGSDRRATWLWAESIRLAEESALDRPEIPSATEPLARAFQGLAEAQLRLGDRDEASRLGDQAMDLWTEIRESRRRRAEDRPDNPEAQLELAEAEFEVARSGTIIGQGTDFAVAEAAAARLATQSPLEIGCRRRLVRLLVAITRAQLDAHQPDKARRSAWRARRLCESALTEPSDGAELAQSLLVSALANRQLGKEAEALDDLRRASEQLEALALRDPLAIELRRDLGAALFEAGRILLGRHHGRDETIDMLRRSLQVRQALRRENPESHVDLSALAASRAALGEALESSGPIPASATAYLLAIASDAASVALAPGVDVYRQNLADHAGALARLARSTLGGPFGPVWPANSRAKGPELILK